MGSLPERYRIRNATEILTPALAIYPEIVEANIRAAIRAMRGDANRWRPHLKTTKSIWVAQRLRAAGVNAVKCSTTAELRMACEAGFPDVLVAYPMVGRNAARVKELAAAFPEAQISILVENRPEIESWRGSGIGIFVDINPGMDRTGVPQKCAAEIAELAAFAGADFRGLHYYDGQVTNADQAHAGYTQLMGLVALLGRQVTMPGEIITSGTPAFPHAISFRPFAEGGFMHRVSPGTIVYNDTSSAEELPPELGFAPAALVLATVVSHPTSGRITCNAGHKSVSADKGAPTCAVLGHENWTPLKPSEEHLPIAVPPGEPRPEVGTVLYLVPRHVCPTVNNFDEALMVENGEATRTEPVNARGHEPPLGNKAE